MEMSFIWIYVMGYFVNDLLNGMGIGLSNFENNLGLNLLNLFKLLLIVVFINFILVLL